MTVLTSTGRSPGSRERVADALRKLEDSDLRLLLETGMERRFDVESGRWVLMFPEAGYEDLSPIYTDEPWLTIGSEVRYLRAMARRSTPQVQAAIEAQIKIMGR